MCLALSEVLRKEQWTEQANIPAFLWAYTLYMHLYCSSWWYEENKQGGGRECDAGCNIIKGWSGKASLRRWHLSQDVKELKEWAVWASQQQAF